MSSVGALYIRVSTDEQVENGYSLDFQKRRLQEYCNQHNIAIFKLYTEEGISGKTITERTALKQLLEDATEHKFDSVFICKTDRLSRNLLDLLTIKMKLDNLGIELVITDEAVNPNDDTGMAMFSMMGVFAELERKRIADRMMSGKKELAMQGIKRLNGRTAFGYTYNQSKDLFEPNENANIVKFIFESYGNYKSASSIARYLNSMYPSDKRFTPIVVLRIIANPIYKGYLSLSYVNVVQSRKIKMANDPIVRKAVNIIPIVSEELWEACNNIKTENAKNNIKKQSYSSFYLKGVLYCGHCDSIMSTRTNGKYHYYFCHVNKNPDNHKNKVCPDGYAIQRDKIQAQFVSFIKSIKVSTIVKEKVIITDFEAIKDDIKSLYTQIDKRNKQKATLLEKLSLELIKDNDYIMMSNKLTNEIMDLQARIQELNDKLNSMQDVISYQENIASSIKQLKDAVKMWNYLSDEDKKKILSSCINKVYTKDRVISKIEFKG